MRVTGAENGCLLFCYCSVSILFPYHSIGSGEQHKEYPHTVLTEIFKSNQWSDVEKSYNKENIIRCFHLMMKRVTIKRNDFGEVLYISCLVTEGSSCGRDCQELPSLLLPLLLLFHWLKLEWFTWNKMFIKLQGVLHQGDNIVPGDQANVCVSLQGQSHRKGFSTAGQTWSIS